MGTDESTAEQLATALGTVLGVDDLPVRLRAWDGSVAGPPGAPVVTVRDPDGHNVEAVHHGQPG